jgi:hypothetical protein
LFGYHRKKFIVWNIWVFLFELLADIVLEEDVGRSGAFGGVWISWFAFTLFWISFFVVIDCLSFPAFSDYPIIWDERETYWTRQMK